MVEKSELYSPLSLQPWHSLHLHIQICDFRWHGNLLAGAGGTDAAGAIYSGAVSTDAAGAAQVQLIQMLQVQ